LKGLVYLKQLLFIFGRKFLKKPLSLLGSFFINSLLLPVYKGYFFIKKQVNKIYQPSGNKFWDIVTHRYIIHGIIILIGLLVVTNNIQARVAGFRDEDYGKQTILYSLVGSEELGFIEETAEDITTVQPTSYLGYQTGIKTPAPSFIEGQESEDIASITEGGTALVKTEVSSMEEEGSKPATKEQIYTVQEGDTVASIAEKFGVSMYTILWENDLTERSYIRPGDQLTVLPATGIKHKIKRGETLDKIAKNYDIEKEKIIVFNDLIDESAIRIGDELFIPGGRKLPAYVAPSRTVRSYVGSPPPSSAAPSSTKLQWPTSGRRITQYYHWRHSGLDIDGTYSSPIYAAENGTVIRADGSGWNGGYGKVIIIDHGQGMHTLYAHLSKIYVGVGERITRGQTIGMMGTTGKSSGTHLHFEVRINGRRLNPLGYIR